MRNGGRGWDPEGGFLPLLGSLVAADSSSPTLGGPGEAAIPGRCAGWLAERGVPAETLDAAAGRPNVVAVVKGRGEGRPILLNSHLDTVAPGGMADPFTLRVEGGRAFGRGAYDMKGSVAIEMMLAAHFAAHPPPGDLYLTLVADEEDRSLGSEAIVRDWLPGLPAPAGAVVLEPTEEQVGLAHKGFAWFEATIAGRAAHGSRPDEGDDAILRLAPLLAALEGLGTKLRQAAAHPLLGHGSLHASTVEGGSGWSVYPDRASLRWERRTLPGEEEGDLRGEYAALLREAGLTGEATPGVPRSSGGLVFYRMPHELPADAAVAAALRVAIRASGGVPLDAGVAFWADSALFGAAGIPTLLYGPCGGGAHADVEWLDLASASRVYEVVRRLIERGIA